MEKYLTSLLMRILIAIKSILVIFNGFTMEKDSNPARNVLKNRDLMSLIGRSLTPFELSSLKLVCKNTLEAVRHAEGILFSPTGCVFKNFSINCNYQLTKERIAKLDEIFENTELSSDDKYYRWKRIFDPCSKNKFFVNMELWDYLKKYQFNDFIYFIKSRKINSLALMLEALDLYSFMEIVITLDRFGFDISEHVFSFFKFKLLLFKNNSTNFEKIFAQFITNINDNLLITILNDYSNRILSIELKDDTFLRKRFSKITDFRQLNLKKFPNDQTVKYFYYFNSNDENVIKLQRNIGIAYYRGFPTIRNYELAAQWFEKAAIYGDSEAIYNLGHMYSKDSFYPLKKDLHKALYYLELLQKIGDLDEEELISKIQAIKAQLALP